MVKCQGFALQALSPLASRAVVGGRRRRPVVNAGRSLGLGRRKCFVIGMMQNAPGPHPGGEQEEKPGRRAARSEQL